MSGVYLHIPFCKQACSYCDFHFTTNIAGKEAVIGALISEMELRKDYLLDKQLDSIYFGGGTPSLLSRADLEAVFEALSKQFSWSERTEITLEANPDDINKKALSDWKDMGINRLSIGVQSFIDAELKWMNRTHSATESLGSVRAAQDAGFDNLTIDLIYGSRFQTLQSWEETLETALALRTQHISSYNLTIENKTVLGVMNSRGKEPGVSDELSSKQFLLMSDIVSQAGFVHYEISNFGKPGLFAKHNSNYWLQQHYLGLGPSAHSFNGVSRQWNIKNNAQYVKLVNNGTEFFEKELLTTADRYNEYVLTRLRTIWGCDVKEIEEQFGTEVVIHFKKNVAQKSGLLDERNGVYTLSQKARLMADGIASDLFIDFNP